MQDEAEGLERIPSEDGDPEMPPDEVFNMIVQAPWEEDIVWSSDEYKPSKKSVIAQSSAGWVPSGNIRTLQGYLANTYRKGMAVISSSCAVGVMLLSQIKDHIVDDGDLSIVSIFTIALVHVVLNDER